MDRDAHKRFLAYLETFPYFNGPSKRRLTREEWSVLDTELRALLAIPKDVLTEEQQRQRKALAAVLLVD